MIFIKLYLLATLVTFIILVIYYKIYTFNKATITQTARKRLSDYMGGRYKYIIYNMRDEDIYNRLMWTIYLEAFLWWFEIYVWIRFKLK